MVFLNQGFWMADLVEETDLVLPFDGTRIGKDLLKVLKLDL